MVVPWVALGLGDALLGTSNGASSHAQDRLLGSPPAGGQPCPPKPCPQGAHVQDRSVEPGVCSPAQLSRGDCPHQHLSCPGGCSPGGIWGAGLSPSGACSLVCAHRHPGRMAWHSLVLLPFLLATGKDSSWHLNGRGEVLELLSTPNTLSQFPGGSCDPKPAAYPTGEPGQDRAGQQGKHGGCSWKRSVVWRCGMSTRTRGLGVPLPPMETKIMSGSWGWS